MRVETEDWIRLPPDPERARPVDSLHVRYDGVTLRGLLEIDADCRTERSMGVTFSPDQRAAISAHWSAELRAKVAAAKTAERNRVTITHDED